MRLGDDEGDMIALRARDAGKWNNAVMLNASFGVNAALMLAQDAAGNIIAVWSSRRVWRLATAGCRRIRFLRDGLIVAALSAQVGVPRQSRPRADAWGYPA